MMIAMWISLILTLKEAFRGYPEPTKNARGHEGHNQKTKEVKGKSHASEDSESRMKHGT